MADHDVLSLIQWSHLECLNQHPDHPVDNAIKQGYREDDGLFLESDTDEQLLIHIPFQQGVRLQSITFKSTWSPKQAPKRVKLFCNRPSLGFSEAAEFSGTQELELSEKELAGESIPLRFVKFQNVSLLTIFVESNQGDEETTVIQKVALAGVGVDSLNVAEIKKKPDEG